MVNVPSYNGKITIYRSPIQPKWATKFGRTAYIVSSGQRVLTAYHRQNNLHGKILTQKHKGSHFLTTIFK
jgi:hypothetical protein